MEEYVVRIDNRGRIIIPSEIRKMLGLQKAVKLRVEGKKIVIEPLEDPFEELSKLVEKVYIKASLEPWKLSEIASQQLIEEHRG